MEYGKLAKAQAARVYKVLYKVPVWPVTLQAVKLLINTSAKCAKTYFIPEHKEHVLKRNSAGSLHIHYITNFITN